MIGIVIAMVRSTAWAAAEILPMAMSAMELKTVFTNWTMRSQFSTKNITVL